MNEIQKLPCKECLCFSVCKEKEFEKIITDCNIMKNLLYSYFEWPVIYKAPHHDVYIKELEKALNPKKWGYSEVFGMVIS